MEFEMAFLVNNAQHSAGDRRCSECFINYPMKCNCGGLIHAQFVKETWQNQTVLAFACDVCGENYQHLKHKAPIKHKKYTRRSNFKHK
jgi:hypothetical protein